MKAVAAIPYALIREVDDVLAAQIMGTNLAVAVAHLRRLAEDEHDDPDRRAALRDAIVDLEAVRRRLEKVL